MANIKSNDKSKRQDDKRNLRNKAVKSKIKTAIKKVESTKTVESVNESVKLIDQAVTSGVFHKNKAARLKSKMHSIETVKGDSIVKKTTPKIKVVKKAPPKPIVKVEAPIKKTPKPVIKVEEEFKDHATIIVDGLVDENKKDKISVESHSSTIDNTDHHIKE